MGSLALSKKNARRQSGYWAGWGTITGTDYISSGNAAHVVYSANLTLGGQALTACQVSTNFVARSSSHAATLRCYLYTFDPTAGSPSTPPAGYTAVVSVYATVPYYGLYQTFSFTGLNITSGSALYFWFVDENSSSIADDVYHYATGNGYTAGPTSAATFTALPMSLSVSPSAVNTGEDVTITVANGSGTSLTAAIKYGGTTLATQNFSTGNCSITCLKAWFDTLGVTLLQSITLSVEVTGGDSTLSDNFTLNAGADMAPTVGTPTITLVQPSSASSIQSFLANISSAKVEAAVTLPTNAAISTVVLSYPGGASVAMSLNSNTGKYEGTTAPITGDTVFTVTATDARGLAGSSTASLTGVVPYTPPSVVIDRANTWRCDSNGVKTSGGEYYRVKATATYYSSLSGNSLRKLTCKIKNSVTETNLTSGTQSGAISGMTNAKASYTIVVTVQDQVSAEITAELTLDGMLRNLVIKRSDDGTYVGIGTTPAHSSGASTLELPAGGKIYIGGVEQTTPDLTPYALAANVAAKEFTLIGTENGLAAGGDYIELPDTYAEFIFEWEDARYSSTLIRTAHVCAAQLANGRLFAYENTFGNDGMLGCIVAELTSGGNTYLAVGLSDLNAPSGTFTMRVYAR